MARAHNLKLFAVWSIKHATLYSHFKQIMFSIKNAHFQHIIKGCLSHEDEWCSKKLTMNQRNGIESGKCLRGTADACWE